MTTPNDTTDQQPEADVRKRALAAANDVFDRRLRPLALPRELVEEAFDAAGTVYDEHYDAETKRIVAETGFAGMDIVDGEVQLRIRHAREFAAAVVASFDEMTRAAGAENYTETEVTITDPDPDNYRKYRFIVVKPGKKSPHELRQEADARIAAAHDALTRIYDGDVEDFATLETTVRYVVDRFRAIAESEATAAEMVARMRSTLKAINVLAAEPTSDPVSALRCIRTRAVQTLANSDTQPPRPRVVVLCGSTRFFDEFQEANYRLTMDGAIVLSVGFYPHATAEHGHGEGVGHDSAQKVALDELHKRKIDMADEVHVLNVGGYIGESTRSEIEYAEAAGKPITYLEQDN